ncbi:hypothetical protein D3C73_844660 [compost metagenome]
MSQRIEHCLDWDTATVHTERYGRVFVTSDTLDQGVLDTNVPKVIDHGVTKTVEGFLRVANAHFGPVTTEPFRRCMTQLSANRFQLWKQSS